MGKRLRQFTLIYFAKIRSGEDTWAKLVNQSSNITCLSIFEDPLTLDQVHSLLQEFGHQLSNFLVKLNKLCKKI